MVHKDSGYDSITAAELTFIEFRRRVKGTKTNCLLKTCLKFCFDVYDVEELVCYTHLGKEL